MNYVTRRFFVFSIAAVVSIVSLAASAETASADEVGELGVQGISDAETEAIKQVIVATANDLAKGDFAAYAQYWVEGGVLMPMNHPRLVGRENIVKFVEANYTKGTEVTFSDWEFAGRDDLAVVTNNAHFMPGDSGEVQKVDQIIVMRKQDDGQWMVQAAIWALTTAK
ncbi:MAG: SgcJ/EcaC family oxidoreductase [Pseudomonadota bacterium]